MFANVGFTLEMWHPPGCQQMDFDQRADSIQAVVVAVRLGCFSIVTTFYVYILFNIQQSHCHVTELAAHHLLRIVISFL